MLLGTTKPGAIALATATAEIFVGPQASALVIHAKSDDYLTDPGGATGDQVVYGVISPAQSSRKEK